MDPRWQKIDQLVSEQKMQQAAELAAELREAAETAENDELYTRALIKEVQLRTALHGYATAVKQLRSAPWPEDPRQRAALSLFYAQGLVTYHQAYGWEIGQRERVVQDVSSDDPMSSEDELELERWTSQQIVAEANRAYAEVWDRRERWGHAPVGLLAEYLRQNNYPPRIRGTLRDTVTYLWVELLADTSLWSAAESNRAELMDLERLLSSDPTSEEISVEEALTAPETHPLTRIALLLEDLESWHRSGERPEAAFEARLERIRRLEASFNEDRHRRQLLADLENHRETLGRAFPWWSMGMAEQARLTAELDDPQALVQAHRLAQEGLEAHPDSLGGKRCRDRVAVIEAPDYQLRSMLLDGPSKRSVQVRFKNLSRLHFRAYRLDLQETVEQAQDYNLLPRQRTVERLVASGDPLTRWTEELPPTPDYRHHRIFVTPPLGEEPGLYVLVASAREDFRRETNRLAAVNLVVSDLVPTVRQTPGALEVQVRSGASGEPVAGAQVLLYRRDWNSGHQRVRDLETGEDGRVTPLGTAVARHGHFLLVRKGEDTSLLANGVYLSGVADTRRRTAALVYTDRSAYRPGQELLWKVVAYRGRADQGRFQTLEGESFEVELVDANGQSVAKSQVTSNEFGSAAGSFTLPPGRLLGNWRVRTSLGGGARVVVEEYKRPTFEVELEAPEEELRLNRRAAFQGTARYYFGLPVVAGEVDWRVVREPQLPPYYWWWASPNRSFESQTVAAGTASLGADGGFELAFTPQADEADADLGITYRFRVEADVTDEGGETRSASRAFRLGFVAVEAVVDTGAEVQRSDRPVQVTIARRDLDGNPRAGRGSWRLTRLQQPAETPLPAALPPLDQIPNTRRPSPDDDAYRTPGDGLRPRWQTDFAIGQVLAGWADGQELASGEVRHEAASESVEGAAKASAPTSTGRIEPPPVRPAPETSASGATATVDLGSLEPGAYRFHYRTEDSFGAVFETQEQIVVAPAPAQEAAKEPAEGELAVPMALLAETSSVEVGETLRVWVHTGLEALPMVFDAYAGPRRFLRRELPSGWSGWIEVPVTAKERGGISLSLSGLQDHQLMTQTRTVAVPWTDRRLAVSFETFRDRLRPGQRETWRVRVASADGEEALAAGAAEVLAYMYDRSLEVFAPHQPPHPLDLYPRHGAAPPLLSPLGSQNQVWGRTDGWGATTSAMALMGDRLRFFASYGVGGMGRGGMTRQLAVRGEAPVMESMAMDSVAAAAPAVEESVDIAFKASNQEGAPPAPPPPPEGDGGADGGDEPQVRSDFSETAFWQPQLLVAEDGSVSFEFEVPDAVTEWSVWAHAVTRDLRSGRAQASTRSVKELLVRPYLPRFLREGDRAELRVVVQNAGEEAFSGSLDFSIEDPQDGSDLGAAFDLDAEAATGVAFDLEPGGSATLTFPVRAPNRVGLVAFRAVGRAGSLSDGELRPLPVLPSRIHLSQSRFAALQGADRRQLTFPDLAADDDASRIDEQLVVTLDAQLFYSVLEALPYLVDYPYECTEQTLNRFVSTGILSSLFDEYPAVAAMARRFAERETQFETWAQPDPNRSMLLVESPWLRQAEGGGTGEDGAALIKVLDPDIAQAQRQTSLAKLREAQTSLGAFPWWPGGPPSPYMTMYILYGFSKALEFGVEVPQDVVVRAWAYLHRHYVDDLARRMVEEDCCWESTTFLAYVLSSYPDESWTGGVFSADDRKALLDHSFSHWKQHSPLLKGYLTLTLERAGRSEDARLVFDSIMDSAHTDEDLGTYWAPEERAWLWYNDTIESHAFALRVLTELDPDDERRHGLVQWLLLNKKLNHWKSTRATAEVLYGLTHYLQREGQLGATEAATVSAGERRREFIFEPDEYTGKGAQMVVDGADVTPAMATVTVEKETPGLLFASATWHFSTERLPESAEGDFFTVQRRFYRRHNPGDGWVLTPIEEGDSVAVGDQVEVELTVRASHAAEYVHLEDPRGAGFEPEAVTSGYEWNLGLAWYREVRDSGIHFFVEQLPAGEVVLRHRLRATQDGIFRVGPATVQSLYAPEFNAYSSGVQLRVGGS
ncbi:MAG: alpha-2-macroglobulin family protein [Acidobacteriota bacterium]|nr:alpha-2-macroglobulin family protein [Acidobacteriota bacterium]